MKKMRKLITGLVISVITVLFSIAVVACGRSPSVTLVDWKDSEAEVNFGSIYTVVAEAQDTDGKEHAVTYTVANDGKAVSVLNNQFIVDQKTNYVITFKTSILEVEYTRTLTLKVVDIGAPFVSFDSYEEILVQGDTFTIPDFNVSDNVDTPDLITKNGVELYNAAGEKIELSGTTHTFNEAGGYYFQASATDSAGNVGHGRLIISVRQGAVAGEIENFNDVYSKANVVSSQFDVSWVEEFEDAQGVMKITSAGNYPGFNVIPRLPKEAYTESSLDKIVLRMYLDASDSALAEINKQWTHSSGTVHNGKLSFTSNNANKIAFQKGWNDYVFLKSQFIAKWNEIAGTDTAPPKPYGLMYTITNLAAGTDFTLYIDSIFLAEEVTLTAPTDLVAEQGQPFDLRVSSSVEDAEYFTTVTTPDGETVKCDTTYTPTMVGDYEVLVRIVGRYTGQVKYTFTVEGEYKIKAPTFQDEYYASEPYDFPKFELTKRVDDTVVEGAVFSYTLGFKDSNHQSVSDKEKLTFNQIGEYSLRVTAKWGGETLFSKYEFNVVKKPVPVEVGEIQNFSDPEFVASVLFAANSGWKNAEWLRNFESESGVLKLDFETVVGGVSPQLHIIPRLRDATLPEQYKGFDKIVFNMYLDANESVLSKLNQPTPDQFNRSIRPFSFTDAAASTPSTQLYKNQFAFERGWYNYVFDASSYTSKWGTGYGQMNNSTVNGRMFVPASPINKWGADFMPEGTKFTLYIDSIRLVKSDEEDVYSPTIAFKNSENQQANSETIVVGSKYTPNYEVSDIVYTDGTTPTDGTIASESISLFRINDGLSDEKLVLSEDNSYTFNTSGNYYYIVKAKDASGNTSEKRFSLKVADSYSIVNTEPNKQYFAAGYSDSGAFVGNTLPEFQLVDGITEQVAEGVVFEYALIVGATITPIESDTFTVSSAGNYKLRVTAKYDSNEYINNFDIYVGWYRDTPVAAYEVENFGDLNSIRSIFQAHFGVDSNDTRDTFNSLDRYYDSIELGGVNADGVVEFKFTPRGTYYNMLFNVLPRQAKSVYQEGFDAGYTKIEINFYLEAEADVIKTLNEAKIMFANYGGAGDQRWTFEAGWNKLTFNTQSFLNKYDDFNKPYERTTMFNTAGNFNGGKPANYSIFMDSIQLVKP